jgi:hypothetical protein
MTCWVKHSEVVGGDRASISCPSAGLAGGLCTGEWPPKPSHPRSKKAGHRKKAGERRPSDALFLCHPVSIKRDAWPVQAGR